jgi:hypothetical protein
VTLDYIATVDAYPRPDDKIRTGELKVSSSYRSSPLQLPQPAASLLTICFATGAFFGNAAALQISGGGNAGNALTAAARLGLNTRVTSKVTAPTTCYACESCSSTYTFMEHPHSLSRGGIHSMIHLPRVPDQVYWFYQVANDETGGTVLSELMEAGIDTSHVIVRPSLLIFVHRVTIVVTLFCKEQVICTQFLVTTNQLDSDFFFLPHSYQYHFTDADFRRWKHNVCPHHY